MKYHSLNYNETVIHLLRTARVLILRECEVRQNVAYVQDKSDTMTIAANIFSLFM